MIYSRFEAIGPHCHLQWADQAHMDGNVKTDSGCCTDRPHCGLFSLNIN